MSDFFENINSEGSAEGKKEQSSNFETSRNFEQSAPSEPSAPGESTPPSHFAGETHFTNTDKAPEEASYTYSYTSENLYNRGRQAYGAPHGDAYGSPRSEAYKAPHEAPYGAPRSDYGAPFAPPPPHGDPLKKLRTKSAITTGTAVFLVISCVVLSLISGVLGSAIVNYIDSSRVPVLNEGDTENNSTAMVAPDGSVVLYRAVETVKEDGSDMTLPEIADLVADSVVEISTEYVSNQNSFFSQYVTEGAGSGVVISQDGYIVTNNHVIYNSSSSKVADTIKIRLRSGAEYEAKLVGRDADSDLAVLKIEATDLVAAVWGDSSKLVVGQDIVVVGNPLGELGGTVTNGIISATSREVQVENVKMTLIQTNAAVNPGNSGGGMFNEKGELIGIINAKSSGTGVEGLGFAIPSDDARDVVEQLLNYGYVKGKVYIGVSFYEANSGYTFYDRGSSVLYVYSVEEGYNDNVLQSRDIVLSIEGTEVSSASDVKAILKKCKVGDTLTFSILRNKQAMDVEVTCYEYTPKDKTVDFNN